VELQPKTYLIVYALIVTPIVISFFFLRKREGPSKLNLTSDDPLKKLDSSRMRMPVPSRAEDSGGEKSLNVFFQWNGHAWDAYEAFGLPAGSSLETVKAAYQSAISNGDPQTLLFFKAAYEAVVRHYAP
jgi:hypothetical protein